MPTRFLSRYVKTVSPSSRQVTLELLSNRVDVIDDSAQYRNSTSLPVEPVHSPISA